jgi:DNA-binding GntR family transcriptional regulator
MSKVDINLGELEYKSLGDRATEHIRDKIIRGEFPPGMKLPEETFAGGLGVSRACIREAFMLLEAEGLVRRVRNKYTEVVTFADKDVEEILFLRGAIEVMCAETSLDKGTVPIEDLKHQVGVIAALDKQSPPQTDAMMEADLYFHELIVRASDNSRAINVWTRLKSQMKLLLYTALANENNPFKTRGEEAHAGIIEALEAKDVAKVTTWIKSHVVKSARVSLRSRSQD